MFVGRSYESGVTTYPPVDVNRTVFYAGTHTFTLTDVGEGGQTPRAFSLAQNYPNPFNPSTTIRYTVGERTRVNLKVYNTLGQEVASLVDVVLSPGEYQAEFHAAKLSSGVYMYKLTADARTETRKMLLVK